MPIPRPIPGLVINYVYLWHHEHRSRGVEGRKDRPCVIVVTATGADGDKIVYVVPVTHTRPRSADDGVEIPAKVKRRLGLDDEPSWIVTTELNRFIWPGYDLRSLTRDKPEAFSWGFLPTDLFAKVQKSLLANRTRKKLRAVPRS